MNVELTEEECLVLFEFFERFDDKDEFYFVHPAEYIVMKKIHSQVCKGTASMFMENYKEQLSVAREKLAKGFQGETPCLKK